MTEKTQQSTPEKLAALRTVMAGAGVAGYIIPHTDEFQCEYTPESANRLEWLTGFTGSAGDAVVLENTALVFTDGRYAAQIKNQIDASVFKTRVISGYSEMHEEVLKNISALGKVGYDSMLMTVGDLAQIEKVFQAKKIDMVPLPGNLIDLLWMDRPAAPASTVFLFPDDIAGRTAADNRAMVADKIKGAGGKAVIINKPDSVAWFLNIRGDDVKHTPLALSYVIAREDGKVDWFIKPSRVSTQVQAHLGPDVTVRPLSELTKVMKKLGQDAAREEKPVLMDFESTPVWFKYMIEGQSADVVAFEDPVARPRAYKSQTEMAGIVEGHIRDGVALVKFNKWLDETAPTDTLNEISAADRLEEFRREDPDLTDLSFPTICGWQDNGAVIHYDASKAPEQCNDIKGQGVLLVDSGGQYKIGATTDVTITRAIGTPQAEQVRAATFVLQGFIRLASARFAEGRRGRDLHFLATEALEKGGLICPHGIGHGVGCFLGVHEAASAITPNVAASKMLLAPGMLVSNEPGAYFPGSWGCRLERLQRVVDDGMSADGSKKMYKFDVVTMMPFDKKLIEPSLLRDEELQWLDDYHDRVYKALAPRLDDDHKQWLAQATAPLKKNINTAVNPRPPGPSPS